MNIRLIVLSIALCLVPAMAQTDQVGTTLAELLNDSTKIKKTITYGTNLLTIPFTDFGQFSELIQGETGQHFREDGANYWVAAYKITLSKGSRIRLKSSEINGDSHLDVYFKNGDKYEFVDHSDDIYASDLDSYLSLTIQKDGDYYIVIADDSPDVQGFYMLVAWIPTSPLYTDIHYKPLAINASPALGTEFNLLEIRGEDFPGVGYSFVAEKGKTYAINANYFSSKKHDMFYSITLLNKLTGDLLQDRINSWDKWAHNVFELTHSILYTADENGTIYILLDNYDPFNQEKFYENVYCTIEIKEAGKKPISLAELLDSKAKTITYKSDMAFVTGGEMIDLVKGQTDYFRVTDKNYYATAYKITLAQGNRIEILSSKEYPYTPWLDSYLYIYRKNGNTYESIAYNDDGYKFDNNMDSYLNFTAAQAGDYYIVVTDVSPDLAGAYYLKVWNTQSQPKNVITAIHANASVIDANHNETAEEILVKLVALNLNGTVGNGTVAIINNPHDWTIASDKRSATYKPAIAPVTPYGFKYAGALEPITVSITIHSVSVEVSSSSGDNPSSSSGGTPIRLTQLSAGNIIAKTVSGAIVLENVPAGAKVEVYNLRGERRDVMHYVSTINGELKINLHTKGVYIMRIGTQTLKVVSR